MLHLASPTDRRWTERALAHLDEVLLDHAHAEKKAASMALTLIFRYPERSELVLPLTRLAREELDHFELLLGHLDARGVSFGRQKPSPYSGRLHSVVRSFEPARLMDTLLCCAVIEARSCERFGLLAEAVPDPGLAGLYQGLLASEARHHETYVALARELATAAEVRVRLGQVARHEAQVLAEMPPLGRLHG